MKKLTPNEFFEMVDVYYDEENNAIIMESSKTLISKMEQIMFQSNKSLIMKTDKLLFLNPREPFEENSLDEYTNKITDRYHEKINKMFEEEKEIFDQAIDISNCNNC